jgi:Phosphotransferase enzyme family
MNGPRVVRELKRDVFGRVELLEGPGGRLVRRVSCGSGWPGTRLLALALLRRERRALSRLQDLAGVPHLADDAAVAEAPDVRGRPVRRRDVLLRSWQDGVPLHDADELPEDFFALLAALVAQLHERGVCHNDLHKENNVLVGPDGRPRLLDFQLASVHLQRGRRFAARCREDLRHVDKHRRRYEAEGRGGEGPPRRSGAAAVWRRFVKPLYNLITRRLIRSGRSEPRRPREGPWPRRTPPVGPG